MTRDRFLALFDDKFSVLNVFPSSGVELKVLSLGNERNLTLRIMRNLAKLQRFASIQGRIIRSSTPGFFGRFDTPLFREDTMTIPAILGVRLNEREYRRQIIDATSDSSFSTLTDLSDGSASFYAHILPLYPAMPSIPLILAMRHANEMSVNNFMPIMSTYRHLVETIAALHTIGMFTGEVLDLTKVRLCANEESINLHIRLEPSEEIIDLELGDTQSRKIGAEDTPLQTATELALYDYYRLAKVFLAALGRYKNLLAVLIPRFFDLLQLQNGAVYRYIEATRGIRISTEETAWNLPDSFANTNDASFAWTAQSQVTIQDVDSLMKYQLAYVAGAETWRWFEKMTSLHMKSARVASIINMVNA
jgi:hypothetical protein